MKNLELALYAKLSGDATLTTLAPSGVWRDVAPEGTTGVFVITAQTAATDEYTMSRRAWTAYRYDVQAVGPGDSAAGVLDAATQIDAVLNDATWTVTGGSVLVSRRVNAFTYLDLDSGERYQHAGGTYLIEAQTNG